MHSKPLPEEIDRRHVLRDAVAAVALLDPESADFDRRISILGRLIAQRATSGSVLVDGRAAVKVRRSGPGWRARWLAQRSRLAHAGQALMRTLRRTKAAPPDPADGAATAGSSVAGSAALAVRDGTKAGRFTEGRFGIDSARRYMLYEPMSRNAGQAPLVVLLHGCQQSAEDFAIGTRMNEAAEAAGVVVLYPEQSMSANLLRCWNWYALQDRSNQEGDAALIAAMTRQVMHDHDIDPGRIYVGGMSAGGAMAAVLARDYPTLYAALGVHSGVPAGLAHDVFAAIQLMSSGPRQSDTAALPPPAIDSGGSPMASIVFHGDEDRKVHPSNGEAIHAAPATHLGAIGSVQETTGPDQGKRGFTRSVELRPNGVTQRELWIIHGAGHAWAGGDEQQKYTDANGPDASREMVRFFLQHQQHVSPLHPQSPQP